MVTCLRRANVPASARGNDKAAMRHFAKLVCTLVEFVQWLI